MSAQTGTWSKMSPPRRTTLILRNIHQHDISKYVDDVVITKTLKSFPNQKVWMNGEVRALSRAKKAAIRLGDKEACSSDRVRLKTAIRGSKAEVSGETGERLQHQQHQRHMAIQTITDYKSRSIMCEAT